MAHFYGTTQGSRGQVSRLGGKASGLTTQAAGWSGCVETEIYHEGGQDRYRVTLRPWRDGGGQSRIIAEGVLDARDNA